MPSPIAHVAVGYGVFSAIRPSLLAADPQSRRLLGRVFVFVIICSLLPDIDVIPGLLLGDLRGIHNGVTNSLLVGLTFALFVGGVARILGSKRYRLWFAIALFSYELHVVADYFTAERGIMALWPITSKRFVAPIMLFYGVHYTEGLISIDHLWTIISELLFAGILVGFVHLVPRVILKFRQSYSTQSERVPTPYKERQG